MLFHPRAVPVARDATLFLEPWGPLYGAVSRAQGFHDVMSHRFARPHPESPVRACGSIRCRHDIYKSSLLMESPCDTKTFSRPVSLQKVDRGVCVHSVHSVAKIFLSMYFSRVVDNDGNHVEIYMTCMTEAWHGAEHGRPGRQAGRAHARCFSLDNGVADAFMACKVRQNVGKNRADSREEGGGASSSSTSACPSFGLARSFSPLPPHTQTAI
jgi:hypothetical protein